MDTTATDLVFPPFRFDETTGTLWRGTEPRTLRPQVAAVLHYLLNRPGLVVGKQELLTALWPGIMLSDGILKTYIWELRRALQDHHDTPCFIETIPRRGYRFIGHVISNHQVAVSNYDERKNRKLETSHDSPQASPLKSHVAKIVGRESEFAQLHADLAHASSGQRRLVFITGEPGIGKTSLVDAFIRQAGAQATLWIARGQCIERYGTSEAYLPILEALGRLGRQSSKKRLSHVLRKYAPSWLVQLPALIDADECGRLQRSLTNVTHERMLREISDALEVLTAEQPLLLALEDLHWSDPSTIDLLSLLARRQEPAQLLIVGTYRTAGLSSNHSLRSVTQDLLWYEHTRELQLGGFSETTVADYIGQRLATIVPSPAVIQPLAHAIYKRTAGHPLFMAHTVDYLLDHRVETLTQQNNELSDALHIIEHDIPQNIQQMIERRADHLNADERRLLETASVVGIEFSANTIATVLQIPTTQVEELSETLVRRHLFLQPSSPQPAVERRTAARYQFQHSLYQQVFYSRLPPARRRQLHRLVGKQQESMYGTRVSEIAGILADHFAQAHEYKQAVLHYEQAAYGALQRQAHQGAIGYLDRALELLPCLPRTPERDEEELALLFALAGPLLATKGYTAPEFEATFSRASELCRDLRDTPRLFTALLGVWGSSLVRGQVHYAYRTAEELFAIAQKSGDAIALLSAHMTLGMPLFYRPQLTVARSHFEQALARYDVQQHSFLASMYGQDVGVTTLAYLSWTLWMLGYPEQARQKMYVAHSLAHEISHPYSLTFVRVFGAWLHLLQQDVQTTQSWAQAALDLTQKHGFPYLATAATITQGWTMAKQGQTVEGIAQLRQGLSDHQKREEALGRPYDLALLAQAHQRRGEGKEALATLTEAFATVARTGERVYEAELYRLKGEFTLQSKVQSLRWRVKSAEECFLKAIDIARTQQAKSWELRATISLARLWRSQGRRTEAHQWLAKIYHWFIEGFDTKDLQEAKVLLEELKD
ncbi:MAG: AAA family ATPase [Candidatus Binatia bacterium]